ncbi:MAG: phage holin [Eubacteriales bacterium]
MNNRYKNPYFWIGLGGIFLSAIGISPEMLTDWHILGEALLDLATNPFMIGSVAMSLLGVFVDPTTKGLADDAREKDRS